MMHQKEYNHMINWVEKHIVQSIFAQKQKETIAKCILDLKLLPKKAPTSQSINASISIETATNSWFTKWKLVYVTKSFCLLL